MSADPSKSPTATSSSINVAVKAAAANSQPVVSVPSTLRSGAVSKSSNSSTHTIDSHGNPLVEEGESAEARQLKQREAHITQLIIDKHEAKKRIGQLEDTVASLREKLRAATGRIPRADGGADSRVMGGGTELFALDSLTSHHLPLRSSATSSTHGFTKVFPAGSLVSGFPDVGPDEDHQRGKAKDPADTTEPLAPAGHPHLPPHAPLRDPFWSKDASSPLSVDSRDDRHVLSLPVPAPMVSPGSNRDVGTVGNMTSDPTTIGASTPHTHFSSNHFYNGTETAADVNALSNSGPRSQRNGSTSVVSQTSQSLPPPTKQGNPASPSEHGATTVFNTGGAQLCAKGDDNSWEQITAWNEELVSTIERLKRAMLKMDTEAKAQLVLVNNELSVISQENKRLRLENEKLKERVADDVLRQRQTNRIEVAMEKARLVARVRAAGQQRLEFMEGVVMEAHDDVYHVQRWDATVAPQRDVSFVFHFVSGMNFPPTGSEEFVFTVYQQILYTTARQYSGYLAASFRGMEVFAFQDPSVALSFAKDCHEQIASLSWPERTETVPFFSTIAEYGRVLFRGPRIHTCIYACTPEVEVDPVTGRSLFFGTALRAGIEAALELSPVGEIVVNDTWAKLFCRAARMLADSSEPVRGDVADVRNTLGQGWDVVGMPGTRGILCSILPVTLKGRRGVQATMLGPTPKYPRLAPSSPSIHGGAVSSSRGPVSSTAYTPNHPSPSLLPAVVPPAIASVSAMTAALVKILKGVAVDLEGNVIPAAPSAAAASTATAMGGASYSASTNKRPVLQYSSVAGATAAGGGGVGLPMGPGGMPGDSPAIADAGKTSAARMLELYSLKQEKDNVTALYNKVERTCAALEREAMQAEDRFEMSRRKLPDPSETAFVCTVDIGDDTTWRRILLAGMSAEEYEVLRNTLRSYVHVAAKHYYGFLMNGNYTDVFTYVFREVEQALAFVSEVYIQVNRTGTKYAHATRGTGQEVFLLRAGISGGPMSTIYRNIENGVLKCTGPVIRLSGTLCDLAQNGEILAMEDIISTFHGKNENLLDTQYNIVKQRGQFLSGCDAPAVVHSILPRPFAYRRAKLMNMDPQVKAKAQGNARSAKAALMVQTRQYPREHVESFLTQQRERLERTEESRMYDEDAYERAMDVTAPQVALKNPWVLTTRPQASLSYVQQMLHKQQQEQESSPFDVESLSVGAEGSDGNRRTSRTVDGDAESVIPELAFMYCDAVGITALKSELDHAGAPPELLNEVRAHFNYVVQRVLSQLGGYVAKTNGKCAYVVLFHSPLRALEAGVFIQQQLLDTTWPDELKTALPTLFVKDTGTSTVLFNGLRAQIALHLSNDFVWKRIDGNGGSSSHSTGTGGAGAGSSGSTGGSMQAHASGSAGINAGGVDISGPAMEEVIVLGRHSHGGELRVSNKLLDAVGKASLSGKLLIGQLAMEVVPTPSNLTISRAAFRDGEKGSSKGSWATTSRGRSSSVARGSVSSLEGGNVRGRGKVGLGETDSTGNLGGRRRSGTSLSSLSTVTANGPASRGGGSALGTGSRRSVSLASTASFRKAKPKAPENLVCVAAVPRRLEGRLALLRSSTFGAAGQAGGEESSANHASGASGDSKGTSDVSGSNGPNPARPDSGSHSRGFSDGERSASGSRVGSARPGTGARRSVPSPPLALAPATAGAPPGVPQPPVAAGSNQIVWCIEASGAVEPLPRAVRGMWGEPSDADDPSVHKEALSIQHMAEELLKQFNGLSLSAASSMSSQPGSPRATVTTDASPSSGTTVGPHGKKKAFLPPPPPLSGSARRTNVDAGGDGASSPTKNSAGSPKGPSSPMASPTATEAKAQLHYQSFMRFSKELMEYYVAAMRVGNERTKPPPLPKLDRGVLFTASAADGSVTAELVGDATIGSADTLGLVSASPRLPAIPGPRGGKAGASTTASFVPRPPSSSAGGGAASDFVGGRKGASGTTGKLTGKAAAAASAAALAKDPYGVALDYLDETCRVWAIRTGMALGKLTTVPTAPQPKSKTSSFLSSRPNRRF